jgi:hypothetical protein
MIKNLNEAQYPARVKNIELNVMIEVIDSKYGVVCSQNCGFFADGSCMLGDRYGDGIELIEGEVGYNRTDMCTSLEEQTKR